MDWRYHGLGPNFRYTMLGTFVKLAYKDGYNTAEVTISQFFIGFIALFILTIISRKSVAGVKAPQENLKSCVKLIVAGTSLGFTSIFYYMAVKYIPVSICIVLLVQAVWMSLIVEMLQKQKQPEFSKIATVVIIIFGTLIATDVWHQYNQINWTGVAWAFWQHCLTQPQFIHQTISNWVFRRLKEVF